MFVETAPEINLDPRHFPDTHTKFNPQQSSTFSAKGQSFYLPYGAGSLYGTFGYDTVNVSQTHQTDPVHQLNKRLVLKAGLSHGC